MRASALLFTLLLAATAAEGAPERTVGVLAHRGDEAALARWQPTFDAVAASTGVPVMHVVPLTLDGVRTALVRGEIDYLFTNPGHLYRLADRHRLSPMVALRTERRDGVPTANRFGAVLFARADSAVRTLADLEGRRLAAVAPDAFGGFEVAAATLVHNGVDPWSDLGAVAFLGFPQERIVDAVLRGEADAGTVRTGVLEAALAAGRTAPGELRVLNPLRVPGFGLALSTELVPEWILSATTRVPEPERRQVAIALLQLDEDHPAVSSAGYAGWTTVPSDAGVRAVLDTVDGARRRADADAPPALLPIVLGLLALGALGAALLGRRRPTAAVPAGVSPAAAHDAPAVHLTPRETEILHLVGDGKTTKEIARDLGISPKTVEFHRGHLMRKYDAHNMAELVRKAGDVLGVRHGGDDPGVSPR